MSGHLGVFRSGPSPHVFLRGAAFIMPTIVHHNDIAPLDTSYPSKEWIGLAAALLC